MKILLPSNLQLNVLREKFFLPIKAEAIRSGLIFYSILL
jgi:hypothetical protein